MTLTGLTAQQVVIADALWSAKDELTIVSLMLTFGKTQVQTVQSMMIAECLDQIDDTDLAAEVLEKFRV